MQLSKSEQAVIDQWADFHRQGGDVVVTYETPDEARDSVVFRDIRNKDALLKAWDRYCGGDCEARVIRAVVDCHRMEANTMDLSEPEQAVVDQWTQIQHQPGDVVVIYDIAWAPYEALESVIFHHVDGKDTLLKAWTQYCNGDPDNTIIREVVWCRDIVSQ